MQWDLTINVFFIRVALKIVWTFAIYSNSVIFWRQYAHNDYFRFILWQLLQMFCGTGHISKSSMFCNIRPLVSWITKFVVYIWQHSSTQFPQEWVFYLHSVHCQQFVQYFCHFTYVGKWSNIVGFSLSVFLKNFLNNPISNLHIIFIVKLPIVIMLLAGE